MGEVVGGIFGYAGARRAANAQIQAANIAAQAALTGYNWLTGPGFQYVSPYLETGRGALPIVAGATDALAQLTGVQPITDPVNNAFTRYLDSTGYKFQLGQGINAISSSGAARGLLQSGGTAKALMSYGQNLASTTFNNYLQNLIATASAAQNRAALGQTATAQIGGAGSQGGVGASNALIQGGLSAANSQMAAMTNLGGAIGGGLNYLMGGYNPFAMGGGGW